jgi:hypothetical protein
LTIPDLRAKTCFNPAQNTDIAPMNLMLGFEPQPSEKKISYEHKLLLIGSCFSDNIGTKLDSIKFNTSYNPTGIIFDPLSIARHLQDYVSTRQYGPEELFVHNELWHSWQHHSDFSETQRDNTLQNLNAATARASKWLMESNWLFITLGTAFSYRLKKENLPVANCHKAPKDWFEKKLLTVEEIVSALTDALHKVKQLNPTLQIVFTVSPVKHIRDGVVENTRSKARLVEAAHQLTETVNDCTYFPAYELVTDVLRDYRFYAPDLAHPNEQAIQYVFDIFCQSFCAIETQQLMQEVKQIVLAKHHRPLHEDTNAHRQFLKTFAEKTTLMQKKLPMLNWEEELRYFNS